MLRRLFIIVLLYLLSVGTITTAEAKGKEVTLKQKIGQMLMVSFMGQDLQPNDVIVKAILSQQVGGVILFNYNYATLDGQSPQKLKRLTQQLQEYTKQAAVNLETDFMPLLISLDYEGGKVARLKEEYGFPHTLSAAEIGLGGDEQAIQYAQQMAETLKLEGINVNFAPVVDVDVNPDNPIIGKLKRSFSSNPQTVINYASIFSKVYQANGILCAYKHFPGHGSSTGDTHKGFVDITQTWKEYELIPYQELLQQTYSCPMVMTAHVVHYDLDSKGLPASLSAAITNDLLREKLHYNGVIVTDDLQMNAITDYYGLAEALRLAINAGNDILLLTEARDPRQLVEMIYADVMSGKISAQRIEESYQRILKLKARI